MNRRIQGPMDKIIQNPHGMMWAGEYRSPWYDVDWRIQDPMG